MPESMKYNDTLEVRERRDTLRTVSNVQDEAFVKMFNTVLWIYLGVCICFVIGIQQGSEYAWDTQGLNMREYVLE